MYIQKWKYIWYVYCTPEPLVLDYFYNARFYKHTQRMLLIPEVCAGFKSTESAALLL
jgi:hypothetical protein